MTFSELTQSETPVLIDFYADWCAPCRAMKPILEDVKNRVGEGVSIYKIDVDKNPMIAQRYSVMSIPTIILFKKGEPVWRKTGVASSHELQQAINKFQN